MLKKLFERITAIYFTTLGQVLAAFDATYKGVYYIIGYKSISYAVTMTLVMASIMYLFMSMIAIGAFFDSVLVWIILTPAAGLSISLSFHGMEKIRDLYVLKNRDEDILK